jgi:(p)ppGpp synthase/HD superfamily hydrolase
MLEKALKYAMKAHGEQLRRYVDEPYVAHPIRVADTVRRMGGTEAMIVAALLHDTVEDTTTTLAEIEALFGPEVARYVEGMTDVTTLADGKRAVRKAIERKRLAETPAEVHTIKLADILDNTETIVERDPKFAKVYMREMRELLTVLTKGHPELHARATTIVTTYFRKDVP